MFLSWEPLLSGACHYEINVRYHLQLTNLDIKWLIGRTNLFPLWVIYISPTLTHVLCLAAIYLDQKGL